MIDFDLAPDPSSFGNRSPFGVRSAVPTGAPPAFLNSLNDKQREASTTTEGPLIVLAGAGSGKTKMLTSRIAYLIEACGVPAFNILAVTFTNKAAAEMRERVSKTLDQPHVERPAWREYNDTPEIGTFHSVCVRILRRELERTPFTKPFVIYDDSDQLSLIKGAVHKLGLDDKAFSPKAMQAAINRAKCDAIESHEMEPAAHNIFDRHLKRVYEQYQKDLFANNALDFGEILCMTYRLFRDHEDIRIKYQKRFRYIHVDEYQDTNRAQYLLLSTLAGARFGGHQNICVVGDEDQSIYKWRGADIRNILDFEKDYPGAKTVKLEQNYRSTKTIITAASQVIKNNRSRKDKTLWTANEDGLPITRIQLADERAEAEAVIAEIKRLAGHEDRTFTDFAIFYRTNAQSRQFEDVFRREKIPYKIVGGLRFYDRKEIKDILSYFRMILNPTDSVSLKRIINTPGRGIGKTTLDKIEELQLKMEQSGELEVTFWAALRRAAQDPSITSNAAAKKLATFVAMIQRFIEEQPKLRLSELYHLVLDEIGYVRSLKEENTEESLARIENLEEFDTLIQEFEEDIAKKGTEAEFEARRMELLPLFIEQSTLASDVDQSDPSWSSVKLMTLHSSKGLEYPVVFLVGMEEGLFPSIKPWEETPEEDIEEERRLCYVGMTRARELLYMSNVVVRRFWGTVNYQEPARFFAEMPATLMEFKDLSYKSRPGSYGGDSGRRGFDDSMIAQARPTGSSLGGGAGDLVGQRIDHPEYGIGTIIAAEGSGQDAPDCKITVEFKGRDRRKFLFRYVKSYLEE